VRARSGDVALAQTALPTTFTVQLVARSEGGEWKGLAYNFISDGYFELLHIPIVGGRALLPTDDANGQPVVVLNRAAAEVFWAGQNPIGRRIRLQQEQAD